MSAVNREPSYRVLVFSKRILDSFRDVGERKFYKVYDNTFRRSVKCVAGVVVVVAVDPLTALITLRLK